MLCVVVFVVFCQVLCLVLPLYLRHCLFGPTLFHTDQVGEAIM